MRTDYRLMTLVVALVAGLALAACGDVQKASGTLEVASVPTAQVAIDGTPHGSTPTTITLDAGRHEIVLSRDRFETQTQAVDLTGGQSATVETVLMGTDPGDPEVIRALAEAFEIDYVPFEGVERHRGSRTKSEPVVLLWPQKDVRIEGLVTYGLEVSIDYMGDGYLVWKKGRTELARQSFTPSRVMTVAVLPTEVREAVKTGSSVTWGLYFDDNRKPITTKFKIVKNSKVEKAIDKLERRKYFRRQPPLTQALMRAQVLHNHRLYTESLLAHLGVVQEFPTSVQPYEGIVTALRRMDGDASELWTLASQHVSGKGGHSRANMPANMPGTSGFGATPTAGLGPTSSRPAMPGMGMNEIPLRLYDPRIETPTAPAVTDPGTEPGTEDPATAGETEPGVTVPTQPTDLVGALTERADALRDEADAARQLAEDLRTQADQANSEFEQATQRANEALEALSREEQAVEDAQTAYDANPTDANEQAVREAHERRDAAADRKAALDAQIPRMAEAAGRLSAQAGDAELEAENRTQVAEDARRDADAAAGVVPGTTPPVVPVDPVRPGQEPNEGGDLDELRRELGRMQVDLDNARQELEELEALAALDPANAEMQAQVAELSRQANELGQALDERGQAYTDAGGQYLPQSGQIPTSPAVWEARLENLRRDLETSEEALRVAEDALGTAAEQLALNPADPAARAAHAAAQAVRDTAEQERNAAAEAVLVGEREPEGGR